MSYQTGTGGTPSYSQPQAPGYPPAYTNQGYAQGAVYNSNQVVVSQPTGFVTSHHHHAPDYLVLSIVAIFFCWPLAICAIMYSVNSRSASACGDHTKAMSDGQNARNLSIAAIVFGLVLVVIVVVLQVTVLSTTYCIGNAC